jgi:hypothetical protein
MRGVGDASRVAGFTATVSQVNDGAATSIIVEMDPAELLDAVEAGCNPQWREMWEEGLTPAERTRVSDAVAAGSAVGDEVLAPVVVGLARRRLRSAWIGFVLAIAMAVIAAAWVYFAYRSANWLMGGVWTARLAAWLIGAPIVSWRRRRHAQSAIDANRSG